MLPQATSRYVPCVPRALVYQFFEDGPTLADPSSRTLTLGAPVTATHGLLMANGALVLTCALWCPASDDTIGRMLNRLADSPRVPKVPGSRGVRAMDDGRAYAEVEAQVGRAAGNIAATNLRYHTWLTDTVVSAARAMQLSLCSAWRLVEIWNNGTTVWQSPDEDQFATVTPEGEVEMRSR